jgi:hypothetical protein
MKQAAKQVGNNSKEFKSSPPSILQWEGQQSWQEPRLEVRYFHKKKIDVWSGYVPINKIKGWVDNVRIELFVERWKRDNKGAMPMNDDILEWMIRDKNEEFKLPELAESIVKNGVRQPVVVTSDGDLLDGNRRYFASLMKFNEASTKGDKATLAMVCQLPAYVLSPSCTKADFDSVLVEENFVDDCREKWPNFIKARKVYEAFRDMRDTGISKRDAFAELMERYGVTRSRVDYYIKAMDSIEEFEDFLLEEDEDEGRVPKDAYEIKWKAQNYFDHFAELSKTQIQKTLENDPEFRAKVFERLFDGDFVNYNQIRKLPVIAGDRVARGKFMMETGQAGVKSAIDWVNMTVVAKKAINNDERIASFKRFLDNIGAKEIDDLDPISIAELQEILEKVVNMAKSVQRGKKK